jgi:hypothetical protein
MAASRAPTHAAARRSRAGPSISEVTLAEWAFPRATTARRQDYQPRGRTSAGFGAREVSLAGVSTTSASGDAAGTERSWSALSQVPRMAVSTSAARTNGTVERGTAWMIRPCPPRIGMGSTAGTRSRWRSCLRCSALRGSDPQDRPLPASPTPRTGRLRQRRVAVLRSSDTPVPSFRLASHSGGRS